MLSQKQEFSVQVMSQEREVTGNYIFKFSFIFRLFPIAVPNKMLFIEYMLSRGINAYRGATQLRYVNPPKGKADCEGSKWLMDHIVYMPIHSGISDKEFRETIERTIDCYHKLTEFLDKDGVPKPDHPLTKNLLERVKL
jgi:hypothetical protein